MRPCPCCSAKNYCYTLFDETTGEYVKTVTKARGFTLQGDQADAMNADAMSAMIRALRQGKLDSRQILQFVLKIDGISRIITSHETVKISGNMANDKRFFRPDQDANKLYAYGITNYKDPA